jgi:hypothetical protein
MKSEDAVIHEKAHIHISLTTLKLALTAAMDAKAAAAGNTAADPNETYEIVANFQSKSRRLFYMLLHHEPPDNESSDGVANEL